MNKFQTIQDLAFKEEMNWEEKAHSNPLYAIMTQNNFENISDETDLINHLDEFYERGEWLWKTYFANIPFQLSGFTEQLSFLEWGCGMGRILNQVSLSGYLSSGVDISQKQLELLEKYFPQNTKPKVEIYKSNSQASFSEESFHCIYSYAVLQHIKCTSEIEFILNEIIRIIKKDGIVKIQFRTINAIQSNWKIIPVISYNFERKSFYLYLRKFLFFYVPIFRLYKHNHWSGAGCYLPLKKYLKIFRKKSLRILSVEYTNHLNQASVWVTAKKE